MTETKMRSKQEMVKRSNFEVVVEKWIMFNSQNRDSTEICLH